MRGGALKRFSPLYDGAPQYGGALIMPVVSGVGKTVKRAAKRKAQGLANRIVDRAAGALTKRAKRGVADLLGV